MYSKENNKNNKFLELRTDLFCQYCTKQCKSLNSLKQHEIRCKVNPNHLSFPNNTKDTFGKSRGWAKGLTKDTDERIAKNAEARKGIQSWLGKHHTEISKQKISESMKNNLNWQNSLGKSGFGKKGTYKGIHCDSTYELAFVIYCLDHNMSIIRSKQVFEYTYDDGVHKYHPDFEVDGNLVEIKGYWQQKVDAKLQAVYDCHKQIKIYYPEDLTEIFEYVFNTYGLHPGVELIQLYDKA